MLAMVNPIDRRLPPTHQTPSAKVHSSCPRFHSDEIASAATSPQWKKIALRYFTTFQKNALKVLITIWNWIKYKVFFFFFDEKRERNLQIAKELYKFQEYYWAIAKNDEGKGDVRYHYSKLSVEARTLVERQLKKMIAKTKSSEPDALLSEIIKKNPFQSIGEDQEVKVLLIEACMDVRTELTMGE